MKNEVHHLLTMSVKINQELRNHVMQEKQLQKVEAQLQNHLLS